MSVAQHVVGKRILITGANGGIGKPAACALARRGAAVILVCRDATRGEAARALWRGGRSRA